MDRFDFEFGTTPKKLEPDYDSRKIKKSKEEIKRQIKINERFNDIQSSKEKLASIQKTNGQLEVSIESSLNLINVKNAAKEKLGMQDLDNSQKVYVTLDKKDYVEGAAESVSIDDEDANDTKWYKKIISKIFGK